MRRRSHGITYKDWITDDALELLRAWARMGLTLEQIAKNIGIQRQTLFVWRRDHKDIEDALKIGKQVADAKVENALFNACLGFFKTIKKPMKVKKSIYDEKSGRKIEDREDIVIVEQEEYYPPNLGAIVFYLKNRKHDYWRDKIEPVPADNKKEVLDALNGLVKKANDRFNKGE